VERERNFAGWGEGDAAFALPAAGPFETAPLGIDFVFDVVAELVVADAGAEDQAIAETDIFLGVAGFVGDVGVGASIDSSRDPGWNPACARKEADVDLIVVKICAGGKGCLRAEKFWADGCIENCCLAGGANRAAGRRRRARDRLDRR
jgi:hypothetical protein